MPSAQNLCSAFVAFLRDSAGARPILRSSPRGPAAFAVRGGAGLLLVSVGLIGGCASADRAVATPPDLAESGVWSVVSSSASGRCVPAARGGREVAAITGAIIEWRPDGTVAVASLPPRGEVVDLALDGRFAAIVHEDGSVSVVDDAFEVVGEVAADAAGGPFRRAVGRQGGGPHGDDAASAGAAVSADASAGFLLAGDGGAVTIDIDADGRVRAGPPQPPAPIRSIAVTDRGVFVTSGRRVFAQTDGRFLGAASEVVRWRGQAAADGFLFVRDPAGPGGESAIGLMDEDLREVDLRRWTRRVDASRLVRPAVLAGAGVGADDLMLVGDASDGAGDHRARTRRFLRGEDGIVEVPEEVGADAAVRRWSSGPDGWVRLFVDGRGVWRVAWNGARSLLQPLPGAPESGSWDGRTLRVRTTTGSWAWQPGDPLPRSIRDARGGGPAPVRAALLGASVVIEDGRAIHRTGDGVVRTLDLAKAWTVVGVEGDAWVGGEDGVVIVDADGSVLDRVPITGGAALLLPTPGGGGAAWVGPDGAMGLIARPRTPGPRGPG